ncbi:MAG: hypothetical protein WKH64_09420 [Chloroflexia bacterium]
MARSRQVGAVGQLMLFLVFWSLVQTVISLPAIMYFLWNTFQQQTTTNTDGSFTVEIDFVQLATDMTSDPAVLLGLGLASAAASIGAVLIVQRMAGGPSLADLGLRRAPGWKTQFALGLVLGPLMFLAILAVELALGWAVVGRGGIGVWGFLASLLAFGFVAVGEEVLARGYLLPTWSCSSAWRSPPSSSSR